MLPPEAGRRTGLSLLLNGIRFAWVLDTNIFRALSSIEPSDRRT